VEAQELNQPVQAWPAKTNHGDVKILGADAEEGKEDRYVNFCIEECIRNFACHYLADVWGVLHVHVDNCCVDEDGGNEEGVEEIVAEGSSRNGVGHDTYDVIWKAF
jgi:hypothetical protein